MHWIPLVLVCSALLLPAASPDQDSVLAETNLERRSALALEKSDEQIGEARKAWEAGKVEEFKSHLDQAGDLADLCYKSLQDSGKRARRSPKWFKRAEQKLLVMLRRVDSLVKDVGVEDRPAVESLQKRLRDVHDQLLQDIMSRK
jgi:hypothetical protein